MLASPDGAGGEASGQSEDPEISADGGFVAFASFASDLIAGTTDPDGELVRDAFVRDLTAGTTEMVSVNSLHQDATRDGNHDDVGAGPVSADGLVVLMGTQADNLFAGDTNGVNDVYASDRRPAADLSLDEGGRARSGRAARNAHLHPEGHQQRPERRAGRAPARHAPGRRDVRERVRGLRPLGGPGRLRSRHARSRRDRDRHDQGDPEGPGRDHQHGQRGQLRTRPRHVEQHGDDRDDGRAVDGSDAG